MQNNKTEVKISVNPDPTHDSNFIKQCLALNFDLKNAPWKTNFTLTH